MQRNPDDVLICPFFNLRLDELFSEDKTVQEEKIEKYRKGFQFSDNVMLRLPTPEELKFFADPLSIEFFGNYHTRINPYTFFLEIYAPNNIDGENIALDGLSAFRLYKAGKIFADFMWWGFGDNRSIMPYHAPPFSEWYQIKEADLENIRTIFLRLNKLPSSIEKRFRVAIDRFNRTYEERRADDEIIDYAIALEALFFSDNKAPINSAGHFIGMGCSMLLGKNREEREEVYDFLVKAFEIRNKIVHGAVVDLPIKVLNEEYRFEEFSNDMQEYVRRSIRKLIE